MALYTLPKGYSSDFANPKVKPVGDVEVDHSNKLSDKLATYMLPSGSSLLDITRGVMLEHSNPALSSVSFNSTGRLLDLLANHKIAVPERIFAADEEYTISWLASKTTATSNNGIICGDTSAGNKYLWMDAADGRVSLNRGSGSSTYIIAGVGDEDLIWRSLVVGGAGTATSYHADGKIDSKTVTAATFVMNAVTAGYTSSVTWLAGRFQGFIIHNKALTDSEVIELHQNPYQILKPKNPPVYFTAAAAGGNTLTADSGTYAYTGTAATLTRTLIMAADSGTYTYSGTAADLLKGNVIVADSGAYTYTGTAATLTFAASGAFTLTADTGAYTYTGTNADLLRGLVVGADSGAYTYTGTNAVLSHGFVMPADSGAYSYTGATITFKRDRVIIAATGAYTYTGTSVSLISSGGGIWTDKTGVTTTWNDQANSTTIWTDK